MYLPRTRLYVGEAEVQYFAQYIYIYTVLSCEGVGRGLALYPGLPMFFNVAHEKGEGLVDCVM